jgi:hypothetical protein
MSCSCQQCMGQGTFRCDWPDDPVKCSACNYPRDVFECEDGIMLCKACEGMGFTYKRKDKDGNTPLAMGVIDRYCP